MVGIGVLCYGCRKGATEFWMKQIFSFSRKAEILGGHKMEKSYSL